MKLNKTWGYGQIFGFSGLDGVNRYYNDFVGTLTSKKIEIRFELKNWIKVYFPISGRITFKAITGDMIDAKTGDGDFFITFVDADTLVGYSPVLPKFMGQKKLNFYKSWDVDCWYNDTDAIGLQFEKRDDGLYKFCIHHSQGYSEARAGANRYMNADIEALKEARYAYYKNMPKCKNKKYEQLYYKALSVQKVNVHTPEGKIPCMWTTPDRVPHKHMWLWDSVFHAMAFLTYNKEMAENCINSVLSQIQDDGFMPHMMNPIDSSDVTQPQVLAWGTWEVYKKTGNKKFLEDNVEKLDRYLAWDMKNRDKNGNGLLEWFTEPTFSDSPDAMACKCGESGIDNSPRFDFDDDLDAIDFSVWAARDALYLSYIYNELGDSKNAEKWRGIYENLKKTINELLWDEETGAYYDRLFNGTLSKVLTPTSFLPLFADIPSKEQAAKMVKTLTDENLLWTALPLATVSKSHPTFSNDMWRGGVWLNLNYFIIAGLKKYGYDEIAEELKTKTLEAVNKWYKKTGAIFEFYAPEDDIPPFACHRKGAPTTPPDWRKKVHAIIDFNWSSCFTLMFIQDELYLD